MQRIFLVLKRSFLTSPHQLENQGVCFGVNFSFFVIKPGLILKVVKNLQNQTLPQRAKGPQPCRSFAFMQRFMQRFMQSLKLANLYLQAIFEEPFSSSGAFDCLVYTDSTAKALHLGKATGCAP
jgi:hypothetical protein